MCILYNKNFYTIYSDIDMKLVHKHVIPRISAEWETVSAYLEYSVQIKNSIRAAHRGFPKECCAALIEDWIGSDNGVKPKTWKTLIEVLSEISELTLSTKQIKECLYQAGVLGGTYVHLYVHLAMLVS